MIDIIKKHKKFITPFVINFLFLIFYNSMVIYIENTAYGWGRDAALMTFLLWNAVIVFIYGIAVAVVTERVILAVLSSTFAAILCSCVLFTIFYDCEAFYEMLSIIGTINFMFVFNFFVGFLLARVLRLMLRCLRRKDYISKNE